MAPSVTHLDQGLAHLAAGRWRQAIAALRTADRLEPGRLQVVRALATACLQAGDPAQARVALHAYTLDQPMCAEGWRLAAQLEWKLHQYDAAMEVLSRGLSHLPNSQILHRQTALFWGARGKLETAALHAYVAPLDAPRATIEPDCLDRLVRDSKLLASLLDLPAQQADVEMLRAVEVKLAGLLETQPDHADRHLLLARLQARLEALPAALLSVQRALRANPRYVEAHRLRATLLDKLGQTDAAIAILRMLVKQGANWPDLHEQIAQLDARRNRTVDGENQHLTRRAA
jgi:Flp pilus assembly protein TadD